MRVGSSSKKHLSKISWWKVKTTYEWNREKSPIRKFHHTTIILNITKYLVIVTISIVGVISATILFLSTSQSVITRRYCSYATTSSHHFIHIHHVVGYIMYHNKCIGIYKYDICIFYTMYVYVYNMYVYIYIYVCIHHDMYIHIYIYIL